LNLKPRRNNTFSSSPENLFLCKTFLHESEDQVKTVTWVVEVLEGLVSHVTWTCAACE